MFQLARHVVGGLALRPSPIICSSGLLQPSAPSEVCLATLGGVRYASRHGGHKDFKKDFRNLRDYPVGPHKALPPGQKYDGRIGPHKNYRHIIHYPENGRYTIVPLKVTKLGGRDPETGRKVIGRVGGGHKQKHRWIDLRRWPQHMDPEGPDLVERVLYLRYDPMRKPWIALTGNLTKVDVGEEGGIGGGLIQKLVIEYDVISR